MSIASGRLDTIKDPMSITDIFDLTNWKLVRASDGGEGEGGEGGEGEEGGEGGEEGEEGASSSGGKSKKKEGSDDEPSEAKLRSDEAAKYRNERNAEKKRADALQAKVDEAERKENTDLQNAEKDRDTFKTQAETLASENTSLKVRVALYEDGALNSLKDPSDASRYLKFEDFVSEDDGEVDTAKLKKALDKLVKDKPYLFKDGDEEGDGSEEQPSGSKPRQRKSKEDPNTREALAKKYPALRQH